jgi:VanZ family protein
VLALRGVQERRQRLAVLALAAVAAFFLLMPEVQRDQIGRLLSRSVAGLIAPQQTSEIGHLLLFALAAFSLRHLRIGLTPLQALALLAALAGLSELVQFLADARTPSLGDWAVDLLGAVLGLLAAMALDRWRQSRAGAPS